jgi:uncharacterized protein YbjT (DUF2867 family)
MGRRKGDSLATVDDLGNRNLVDAAARAGVGRFVFTSILTCDHAPDVPHFWQKKLTEGYLQASGTQFVALRPGALIGGAHDFWARDLKKRRMTVLGKRDVPLTSVHIDDVARYLAMAVDKPGAGGRRIDIGMDRAVTYSELGACFTGLLGHEIKLRTIPWGPVNTAMKLAGLVKPSLRDLRAMLAYFSTGQSIADTTLQAQVFGAPPTVEDSLRRYLQQHGLQR